MNPESAADYVAHSNLKGLVEWITAEAILTRPEDPVQFARDLLGQKLVERSKATDFRPDEATGWLRATYAKAVAEVDENGIIHGENIPSATVSVSEELALLKIKMDGVQTLLHNSAALSVLNVDEIARSALPLAISILHCDRSMVYIYDPITNEMIVYASSAENNQTRRVPRDEHDIVGSAISGREVVNIEDVYSDSRFDKTADKETGYRTTTTLCAPMIGPSGDCFGALLGINKDNDVFREGDEDLIMFMANTMTASIHNAHVYLAKEDRRTKALYSLQLISTLASQLDDHLATHQTIIERAAAVADAEKCTFFYIDEKNQILYEIQGEENKPHSLDRGIPAKVITSNHLLSLKDAYESALFNAVQDKQTGFHTKALLCVPIRAGDSKIIGAMQFSNKKESPSGGATFFTPLDEENVLTFMETFGQLAAKSALYKRINAGTKQTKKDKGGSDSESD